MKKIIKILIYSFIMFGFVFLSSCQRKIYTITFEENGGSEVSDIQIPVNEVPIMPENPSKEGYTFGGWYLDEGLKFKYSASKMEGNIALYAKWNVNSYSISYNTNGAGQITSSRFDFGSEIELPNNPEKAGHDFVGWYTDAALTEEFTLTTMPAKNITLYASWQAYDFVIKFISQDEEVLELRQTVEYNEKVTRPADPTREGYTFVGWYLKDEAYDFSLKVAEDITLTAAWTINLYTITYDTVGGSSLESQVYKYYDALNEPERPTKPGYLFGGWTLEGKPFSFVGSKMPAKDITLKVVWLAGDYSIYFNKNNASATGNVAVIAAKFDEEKVVPENSYSLTGYTFKEWNTRADGLGTTYNPGDKVVKLTTTDSVNLYAIWTSNKYSVLFDSNGGQGSMPKQEMTYDKTSLNANVFTKQGYTFKEWNTKEDGTGVSFANNSMNISSENNKEVKLYAIWQANSYQLTYNSNGSEEENVIQTVVYDTTRISKNLFDRVGYTFVGWNTSSDGEGRNVMVDSIYAMEETTLYAQWKENNYTVVFNSNNGLDTTLTQKFTYEEKKVLSTTSFAKDGYTLSGWAISVTGTKVYDNEQEVQHLSAKDGDIVNLYAVWTANSYTIKFDNNTGIGTMDDLSMTYDVAKTLLDNSFNKTGYKFNGWNTSSDGTGTSYANKEEVINLVTSGSITLYAQWKVEEYTVVFNSNYGTNNHEISEVNYEEKLDLTNPFVRTGYTFKGWALSATGEVKYTTSVIEVNVKDLPELKETYNLYAIWQENSYNIVLNANYGEVNPQLDTINYEGKVDLTNPFVRKGYTFEGWALSENGEVEYTTSVVEVNIKDLPELKDIYNLYAIWTINTYKVTVYHNADDKEDILLDYNALIEASSKVEATEALDGFDKWLLDNNTFTFGSANMPDRNIVIYATFKDQSTIIFETNGGSSVSPQPGFEGDSITIPSSNPTKEGYTFAGWYEDETLNNEFDFANIKMPSGVLTIYAQWTENEYTLYLYSNYGDNDSESQLISYETLVTLSNPFNRTGYTFAGWTEKNSEEIIHVENAKVNHLSNENEGIYELYAKWTENTYNIVLNANYGVVTPKSNTINYEGKVDLANPFNKTGYTFKGWALSATGEVKYNSDVIEVNVKDLPELKETYNLYAIWQENTYNIVLNANYENANSQTNTINYEGKVDLANPFNRIGYTFKGWALTATGEVKYNTNVIEANVKDLPELKETYNLYAIWQENTYRIVFDSNKGVGNVSAIELTYTQIANLPTIIDQIVREGYSFAGWNTASDGTGTTYANGVQVSKLKSESGDYNLYAIWTANKYSVVFNSNNGEGTMNSVEMTYNQSVLPSNIFTRYGYSFVEWNTASDGTGVSYRNNSSENLTSINGASVTLYAQWSPNVYTLTYKANGASGNDVIQDGVIFGQTSLINNQFERVGYEFVGWNTLSNGKGTTFAAGTPLLTTETTLYATWNELFYTVTLQHGKNDSSVALQPVGYTGQITLNSELFDYDGYKIDGWSFDEGEAAVFEKNETINVEALLLNHENKTATLVAHWAPVDVLIQFVDAANNASLGETTVKYDSQYSTVNIPAEASLRMGSKHHGFFTDSACTEDDKFDFTGIVKDEIVTIYVKYEQIKYTVKFIVDGETVYSVNDMYYGQVVSFNDYVKSMEDKIPYLRNLDKALELALVSISVNKDYSLAGQIGAMFSGQALTIPYENWGENNAIEFEAGIGPIILSWDERIASLAMSQAFDQLYSLVNTIKNDYELRLEHFRKDASGNYYPTKDNMIFGNWVLGEDTMYTYNDEDVTIFNGTVPASRFDEQGSDVKIVAKWKGVSAVSNINFVKESSTLSWDHITLEGIENPTVKYYIYHVYTINGIEYKTELDVFTPTNEDLVVVNDQTRVSYLINTENETDENDNRYIAPGSYKIKIIAEVTYTDDSGKNIVLTSENNKEDFDLNINKQVQITIGEELAAGDYYTQVKDESTDDYTIFYFYTNMEYTFGSSTFVFVDENNENVVGAEAYRNVVKFEGNKIITSDSTNEFFFRTEQKPDIYYKGSVLPLVTQFDFGENLQQFNLYNNGSEQGLYLADLQQVVYQIGVHTKTNEHVNYLVKEGSDVIHDNGFKFDLSVKSVGGISINPDLYENYFVYKFIDVNTGLEIPATQMGYFDKERNIWYFKEELLSKSFVSDGNSGVLLVDDPNAKENNRYKVEISIYSYYVPDIVEGTVIGTKSFVFHLNDKVNVFTHEELQKVYGDISLVNGINIHSNIEVTLDDRAIYGNYDNVFDDCCYARRTSLKNDRNAAFEAAKGSVINPEMYDFMNYLYNNKDAKCSDLHTGHPYMRASIYDNGEKYIVNGNLFTLDASKLPKANIYSIGALSEVPGYEIVNTKTSIFTYMVSNYNTTNWNEQITLDSTAEITFNNLSIIGNTKNSSLSTDGIDLMNKNSGGHCGIQSWYGATMYINNTAITNATIALYMAQNSSAIIDYLYSGSNWANTIYSYGGHALSLTNSWIEDSGGAAIHFEDLESTKETPTTSTIYMDHTNTFNNYVSGEEGYFKANSMEIIVLTLKSGFEAICRGTTGNKYTLIEEITNPVNGYKSEKLNLILLAPAAGQNKESMNDPVSAPDCLSGQTWAGQNFVKISIGNDETASDASTGLLGVKATMNGYSSADIDGSFDASKYPAPLNSQTEPGFGVMYVADGIEKVGDNYKNVYYVTSYVTDKSVMGTASIILGASLDQE